MNTWMPDFLGLIILETLAASDLEGAGSELPGTPSTSTGTTCLCVLRNYLLNSRWGIPFLIQKSLIEMFCSSYSVLSRNQAFSKSLLLIIPFYCLLNLTAQRYKLFHGLPKTTFGRLQPILSDCHLLMQHLSQRHHPS